MPTPKPYDNTALNVFSDTRGSIAHGQATITGATTLRAPNFQRRTITIKALTGGGILYVGASGVAAADGYEVKGGESLTLGRCTDAVYVTASASTDVRFIEELAAS